MSGSPHLAQTVTVALEGVRVSIDEDARSHSKSRDSSRSVDDSVDEGIDPDQKVRDLCQETPDLLQRVRDSSYGVAGPARGAVMSSREVERLLG
jgi:hypothetical protein